MHGYDLIRIERIRQVHSERYAEEDDVGKEAELVQAAMAYSGLAVRILRDRSVVNMDSLPVVWPWAKEYWKPSDDPKKNLVKAGALIAAAIDALEGGTT